MSEEFNMEKSEITLSFDSEKMTALSIYLQKENSTVQKKMDEALGSSMSPRSPKRCVSIWTPGPHQPVPNARPGPTVPGQINRNRLGMMGRTPAYEWICTVGSVAPRV